MKQREYTVCFSIYKIHNRIYRALSGLCIEINRIGSIKIHIESECIVEGRKNLGDEKIIKSITIAEQP